MPARSAGIRVLGMSPAGVGIEPPATARTSEPRSLDDAASRQCAPGLVAVSSIAARNRTLMPPRLAHC
jgi:hypothetical protein